MIYISTDIYMASIPALHRISFMNAYLCVYNIHCYRNRISLCNHRAVGVRTTFDPLKLKSVRPPSSCTHEQADRHRLIHRNTVRYTRETSRISQQQPLPTSLIPDLFASLLLSHITHQTRPFQRPGTVSSGTNRA